MHLRSDLPLPSLGVTLTSWAYAQAWLPGRAIVEQCLRDRHSVHPSGAVIKLKQYCPWKEHMYDLEAELGIEGQIKFCLYQVGTSVCMHELDSYYA